MEAAHRHAGLGLVRRLGDGAFARDLDAVAAQGYLVPQFVFLHHPADDVAFLDARGRGVGLRLGVKKTGCSGYAYVVNYADEVSAGDVVFEAAALAQSRHDVAEGYLARLRDELPGDVPLHVVPELFTKASGRRVVALVADELQRALG